MLLFRTRSRLPCNTGEEPLGEECRAICTAEDTLEDLPRFRKYKTQTSEEDQSFGSVALNGLLIRLTRSNA
jgi:hypothetical protein